MREIQANVGNTEAYLLHFPHMSTPPFSLSYLLALEAQLLSRPFPSLDPDLFPQAHQTRLNSLISQSQIPTLEAQKATCSRQLRDLATELMLQRWEVTQIEKEIAGLERQLGLKK